MDRLGYTPDHYTMIILLRIQLDWDSLCSRSKFLKIFVLLLLTMAQTGGNMDSMNPYYQCRSLGDVRR